MPEFSNPSRSATPAGEIVVVVVALIAIGVVMVASASASVDRSILDDLLGPSPLQRQLLFALVGIAMLLSLPRLMTPILSSPRLRRMVTKVLFFGALLGLVAVWIPALADVHRGSHRWLRIGAGSFALSLQPSEIAKLAMVLFLAYLLTDRGVEPRCFRHGFVPPMLAAGACIALVGVADFGTAALLAGVAGLMLWVARCRWTHLTALSLCAVGGLGVLLYVKPYRLDRIYSFLHMWEDPQGVGYQPIQSLATIAAGGWTGVGLGGGVQKYGYLPESHTDFIFSVLCEETGVLGGLFVLGLFGALVWLGLRTMRRARSPFEGLVALGLTAMIGLQAAINIAVVTVVVPTKGISLPLISAGGSGLLASCLAMSILASIAARTAVDEQPSAVSLSGHSTEATPRDRQRAEQPAW